MEEFGCCRMCVRSALRDRCSISFAFGDARVGNRASSILRTALAASLCWILERVSAIVFYILPCILQSFSQSVIAALGD